jgi:hypothetical protein
MGVHISPCVAAVVPSGASPAGRWFDPVPAGAPLGSELVSAASELRAFASYVAALRGFLRETVPPEVAVGRMRAQLERREESFLRLLDQGVFRAGRSPYVALFAAAGIERGDLVALVREQGVESALGHLYDAGVRLTVDELRGHEPIRRGSFELAAAPEQFDNPVARTQLHSTSGASRGSGTPIGFDLRLLEYHAVYHPLVMDAFGFGGRRSTVWMPMAPATTGLRTLLSQAKVGHRNDRWFSQSDPFPRGATPRHALFAWATVAASRIASNPLPWPRHVPPDQAAVVARWMARVKRESGPGLLHTPPSGAVRVCVAAQELGLDITGTFFRVGSEPYTAARAQAIAEAGCSAASNYFVAELGGYLGLACARDAEWDEVHLLADKVAVVQRERQVGPGSVGALAFTTVHELSPKVLINFESGDYGILRERDCGCLLSTLGLRQHLHGIRSYEKLTSEGMTFVGGDVITLLEEVLPSRFGGGATDFQLVEYHHDRLPAISILVSPRLGPLDERAVVDATIEFLRSLGRPQAMMADVWRKSGTLGVVRRDPYVTGAAKTPAVHVLGDREPPPSASASSSPAPASAPSSPPFARTSDSRGG